jgi:acetyl esterase/lipase
MPENPHPAQVEDVAAAFAWVVRNISQYGGDPSRIYLSGHSAGAHLAALLALDEKYLKKIDISRTAIRAVIACAPASSSS